MNLDGCVEDDTDIGGVVHRIYSGRRHRGNKLYLYGKCSCGATLEDEPAIERHRQQHEQNFEQQ